MHTTIEIETELSNVFDKRQAQVLSKVITTAYNDLVKTSDFNELKAIVKELAEAQNRTESRVEELAEAQKGSEKRLTRLEISVGELTVAQSKTEREIKLLTESVNRLVKRGEIYEEKVDGLSDTFGYTLENLSYRTLPALLIKDNIEIQGRLLREYYRIGDKQYQINIYGKAVRDGEEILILGESKTSFSKKEVNRFVKVTDRIKKIEQKPVYLIAIAHDFNPSVINYLDQRDIKYYWSYELEEVENKPA